MSYEIHVGRTCRSVTSTVLIISDKIVKKEAENSRDENRKVAAKSARVSDWRILFVRSVLSLGPSTS